MSVNFSEVRGTQTGRMLGQVVALMSFAGVASAVNRNDFALDVWTGTVSSSGPTEVTFTPPNGTAATTPVTAAATAAGVITNLSADEDQEVLSYYDLVASASTTIVATAKRQGSVNGAFTSTTNLAWSHTPTGAVGGDLYVGRAARLVSLGTGPASPPLVADPSGLTAQVATLTAVYEASAEYRVGITVKAIDGGIDKTYWMEMVVASVDSATTATAIAAAINAVMPSNTVIAAATSGGALTLTAEVAGIAFKVEQSADLVTTGSLAVAKTTGGWGDPDTDLDAALFGVVTRDGETIDSSSTSDSLPVVPPRGVAQCLRYGDIVVPNSDGVALGEAVFVSIATSSEGLFYNATAANRVPLPLSRFMWVKDETGGRAILRVNLAA